MDRHFTLYICGTADKKDKQIPAGAKALDFIAAHPNYPEDGVPYRNFDVSEIPDTYRDTSAASVLPLHYMKSGPIQTRKTAKNGRIRS